MPFKTGTCEGCKPTLGRRASWKGRKVVSNKQEPLSGATSVASTTAEPFDFMLELEELDRAEKHGDFSPGDFRTKSVRRKEDFDARQSNVITKPPPPLVSSSPAASKPERSAPSLPSQDWDEVTPRSTSVAAALLSSPNQLGESAPVSSDSDASPTPSTEPTGGRHPVPKPAPASAPPFPFTAPPPPKSAASAMGAAPFPTPAPFPLTGPSASAALSGSAAPLFSPPIVARASRPSVAPAAPVRSPLPPEVSTARSAPPGPEPELVPGSKFSPSFTLDSAPITTRGTYKRGMEARVREPKPRKYKWPATVAAAFALPFLGAIALTSWIESTRFKSAAGVPNPDPPQAVAAPGISPPVAQPVAEPVAPGEQQLVQLGSPPVTLTQSLRGAPPTHTTHAASKPVSVRLAEPSRSRPTLDNVDFGAGLTSATKTAEPSYRVKIPDQQKSLDPRNGAHNVPVNE